MTLRSLRSRSPRPRLALAALLVLCPALASAQPHPLTVHDNTPRTIHNRTPRIHDRTPHIRNATPVARS